MLLQHASPQLDTAGVDRSLKWVWRWRYLAVELIIRKKWVCGGLGMIEGDDALRYSLWTRNVLPALLQKLVGDFF